MQLYFAAGIYWLLTWKTHCGLKFHFGQIDRSEICSKVSFTTPKVMWVLIMKLTHTEVKFYLKVKCQTSLSSLWVSCNCALRLVFKNYFVCFDKSTYVLSYEIHNTRALPLVTIFAFIIYFIIILISNIIIFLNSVLRLFLFDSNYLHYVRLF